MIINIMTIAIMQQILIAIIAVVERVFFLSWSDAANGAVSATSFIVDFLIFYSLVAPESLP